jgi:hypothetical protein
MAARSSSRIRLNRALIALALVLALPVAMPCATSDSARSLAADASQAEKTKAERERCKKTEGTRAPKDCPDGGERLPQDKRSPLDSIPPLSPLVA